MLLWDLDFTTNLRGETIVIPMPSDHPFQQLFETFGKLPEAHSEAVNREAREEVKGLLKVPLLAAGHCILLKAPRAGHGKTHLLTTLQHDLGGTHEFVPLRAISGSRIDAATVLDDTLRRLVRGLPAAGGLTVLDLVTRRLFSSSLQPLVNSGEVPCQDREGAINALRNRPIETFDFHHPSAVTAHWARENFELLGPRLALELSQRDSLSLREVSFWIDAMFLFASTPIDNPGRVRTLAATVFDNPGAEASAHERLVALLGLLTSLMRVVLVADEVEGFSSDETAALRFASFIGALRQSAERVDLILSVNEDVWKSAFLPRLSDGLADRLSEVVVELEPLDRAGMLAVLESRSPGSGEKILSEMETGSTPTHARGLIREAGIASQPESSIKLKSAAPQPTPEPESSFSTPAAVPAPIATPNPEVRSEPEQEPLKQEDLARPVLDPPVSYETSPKPDFSAGGFPVFEKPPEPNQQVATPTEGRFSPEAAIAAFAAASAPAPDFSTSPPATWPLPDVSESPVLQPSMSAAEPVSAFQVVPVSQEQPPASMFNPAPEPPEDAVSAFQAAPVEEPAPVFQAPPVKPAVSAFQLPPVEQPVPEFQSSAFETAPPIDATPAFTPTPPPAGNPEANEESAADRVDDLLRQFRERYGKNN